MNPYSPMFRHPTDQLAGWLLVIAFILLLGAPFRHRFGQSKSQGEKWCISTGSAMLLIDGLVLLNFVIGYVFLIRLQIISAFWVFWQLAYLLSVLVVFWILPVVLLLSTAWTIVGVKLRCYSRSIVTLCLFNWVVLLVNILAYFAFNTTMA